MSKTFDTEALEEIPIQDVVNALGGSFPNNKEPKKKKFHMHCCNKSFHEHGDSKPSMMIWTDINVAKCLVCGTKGNTINVARAMHDGSFVKACEWLHETFNIPYKEDDGQQQERKRKSRPKPKQIEYVRFDPSLGFTHIEVKDFIDRYESLNKEQKLKLVYSYIYRFSMITNREPLEAYLASRKIVNQNKEKLGFLSEANIATLVKKLKQNFPIEDLVEFGVINDDKHQYFPLQWKQVKKCLVIPSFSIYTDLVEGMMLRPIDDTNKWFQGKESRLSTPIIVKPMPFGVGFKLLSKDCDIYITEGSIDALSLPDEYCFIATPGVQAFEEEQLGILRNRNIKLVFDQDEAGQKAAWGFTELKFLGQTLTVLDRQKDDVLATIRLLKSQGIEVSHTHHEGFKAKLLRAGAKSVEIAVWDKKLGKDINELLVNGNLNKVKTKK